MKQMVRHIIFFVKSLAFSAASFFQALIHMLYGRLIPLKNIKKQRNILVVQLGQIGDFVLSAPLFRALKEFYGHKLRIALLTDPINMDMAQKNSYIDDIIVYRTKKYTSYKKAIPHGTPEFIFPGKRLKRKTFQSVIWLRGDFRTFLWILKNRVPFKSLTKYPNPLRWSWLPLITGQPVKRRFRHYLECLGELNSVPYLSQYSSDMASQEQVRKKNIFVHIGAGSELRRWPEENFSELCKRLLELDNDCNICLIGSGEDAKVAETVRNHRMPQDYLSRINNLCGKIHLTELGGVLSTGLLYIGFDSGPMHIAALSGIPIVALMGPQSPQIFGPKGEQEIRIVYKDYFCSPCWQFSCLHVKSGAGACVLAIKPDEVFEQARAVLKNNGY